MTKIIVSFLLIADFILAQENVTHSTVSPNNNVTKLDLSKKGLTTLKDYDFSKYPQLEEIDLSGNDITHIKEDIFQKNEKLRSINLSGNKNLEFPKYSTIFISHIVELNITNCGIKTLPQSAFDGLRHLKIIDLHNNPLEKKSFSTTPFRTLESLEKVILPVENRELLEELCLSENLTIQIINEKQNIPTVQCLDYTTNKSEEDLNKPTAASLSINPPDPEKPPAEITNTEEEQATSHPHVRTKLEPRANIDIPKLPGLSVKLETTNETASPTGSAYSTNKQSDRVSTTIPKLEPRIAVSNQSEPENVSTVIPDTPLAPVEIKHTSKPFELIETQTKPTNLSHDQQVNKSEIIQEVNTEESAKVGEVTEASNTGSTILIVLVVLVVISGLAAFGYKFYKNKTARAESEQVERELKQIVTNKSNRAEDMVEKEPLMNNLTNRENGDVKSSPINDINNALNPHVGPGSRRNSGSPYQPTTTSFKPDSASEVK